MPRATRQPKKTKQTVSLTIDSALYAEIREHNINASSVAENALRAELARLAREKLLEEIRQDLEAGDAYIAKHGSFTEMVREHYAERDK